MEAFWEISTDRPITMGGAAPIPRSAISDYINTEGITEARAFRRIQRILDNGYLRGAREHVDA